MKNIQDIDFNAIRDRVHQIACEHGWHDEEHSVDHYMMLIITEFSEAVNADRRNRHAKVDLFNLNQETSAYNEEEHFMQLFEMYIKDTVEDELADAAMRVLDFAKENGIDFGGLSQIVSSDKLLLETFRQLPDFCTCTLGMVMILITEENLSLLLMAIFEVAELYHIDLLWHIEQKMKYNEMRPYKHGGKKY